LNLRDETWKRRENKLETEYEDAAAREETRNMEAAAREEEQRREYENRLKRMGEEWRNKLVDEMGRREKDMEMEIREKVETEFCLREEEFSVRENEIRRLEGECRRLEGEWLEHWQEVKDLEEQTIKAGADDAIKREQMFEEEMGRREEEIRRRNAEWDAEYAKERAIQEKRRSDMLLKYFSQKVRPAVHDMPMKKEVRVGS
jgi:hypothetical protein